MLKYNLCFENHDMYGFDEFVTDDIKSYIESLIGFPQSPITENSVNYKISLNPLNISRNKKEIFNVYNLHDYIFSFFPKKNQNIYPLDDKYDDIVIDFINKLKIDNINPSNNISIFSDKDHEIPEKCVKLFTTNENINIEYPLRYDRIYIIGFDILNERMRKFNNVQLVNLADYVSRFIYKNFYDIRS